MLVCSSSSWSAPLLPRSAYRSTCRGQAKSLSQNTDPLTVTIDGQGQIYLQETKVTYDELLQKLQADHRDRRQVFRADLL